MKRRPANNLLTQLARLQSDLDVFAHSDSRAAFLKKVDDLISRLTTIRAELTKPALETRLSEIEAPLARVIEFLEAARTNETLAGLLSAALQMSGAKPPRTPIEIPQKLTNEQIRALLAQDLSKTELKAIAAQRGISVGKASIEQVKRDIIRALDRQDGYERLASPRS